MNRPATVAASTPVQAAKAIPANTAAPAPQARNQTQAIPPVVTPTPEVKSAVATSDFAADKQAKLEELRREQRAKQNAALEVQKQQEQEKAAALELQRRQDREKIVDQITSTLTNQVALLSKFKTDCQTRLNNNTNKDAEDASADRKSVV